MQKIFSFIKFILNSTNQHGIHSPFVFDLTTRCFYNKKNIIKKKLLKSYKYSLLNDKSKIVITDFGAGSKVFKSNLRAVNKIAKYAGINSKRGALLANITNYFKPASVLEFGTSLGIGTAAIHIGFPTAKIITLEGCENTAAIAKKQFKKFSFKNIEILTGDRKSTRLNSSHITISYAVFCLKKKKQ